MTDNKAVEQRTEVFGIAFTDDRDQVLLARHQGYEFWELPGVTLENGEPLRDAVQRAFATNVGLTASAGQPLYFSDDFVDDGAGKGWHIVSLFYLARASGDTDPHHSNGVEAAWVPIEDLDSLAISDASYDAIQHAVHWLDMSEGPRPEPDDDDE